MTRDPAVFRHESFLLTLPFDAGLPPGIALHMKDEIGAQRSAGWEAFDLGTYLGLDSPEAAGDIASTTLMFSTSKGQAVRPWRSAEEAWPRIFSWKKKELPLRRRLLTLRPLSDVRDAIFVRRFPVRDRVTVVQAVRLASRPRPSSEEWRFSQMHHAIEHLNDFLTAVMSVRRDPEILPIAAPDLPAFVWGFGWDLHADGARSEVEWQGYMVHDRLPSSQPPMTKAETDLATWIAASRDHPMKAPGDYILGAWADCWRGRYRHAITDSGTGIETLVSAVVRLAGTHLRYSRTKLTNVLDAPFASRLREHFARMLSYDPDPARSSDPLGEWWRDGYLLRNRVVHLGYRPSEADALTAVGAAERLHQDVGARLKADAQLQGLLFEVPADVVHRANRDGQERRA